jgi:16S rRNA (cytosine1402-N4)-methyltransferase
MSAQSPGSGESSPSVHRPVLVREVLRYLDLKPGLIVVDGTVGGGGHSQHILKQIGEGGKLIGLDRDPAMLSRAAQVLSAENCSLHQASYAQLDAILTELGIPAVDRILVDLGLSSDQLADDSRGFGFDTDGVLDLRFDPTQGEPAWQFLQRTSPDELARILDEYGEERFSVAIAREITARQRTYPVRTAGDLVEAIAAAVPAAARAAARKHPATRVFQALRIAVNDELGHLSRALESTFWSCLRPGGRLVVLTFHSLEDRLVKDAFRNQSRWQNLTPKPLSPSPAEQRLNRRSRSAKLRAAIRKP